MIKLLEYVTENDVSPFGKWFGDIDVAVALRVRRALAKMELGNFGDSKAIGDGVSEYRLTFGPGYRIYYGRDGDTAVVLLIGGTKKRQSVDIDRAKRYWADYKARKGDE